MGDVERTHVENTNEAVADSPRYGSVTSEVEDATGSTDEAVGQQ
jgi:hypothetical protein